MSMHLHTVLHVSLLRDQGSEWALSCLLPKAPSNSKAKLPVMLGKYLRVSDKNIQGPTFTAAIQGIDPYIIYF